jgi:predicted XRE-type DNA-binding protein
MAKRITESSGNVFADLGLADAEALDLKAELAMMLGRVMKLLGINQTEASELTGISQPDLSRFLRGHLRDVSAERLMNAMTHLSAEIDIRVRVHGEPVGDTIHLTVPA